MKIYQVEELVGITKKNIRFYEDEGLLNPERNPENGYREYSLADVGQLQKIKLLRKLSVPIEDIRLLQKGKMNFSQAMNQQISYLEKQQESAQLMKDLCSKMKDEIVDFSQINAETYLEEMYEMETKGTKFVDIEKEDINRKKKTGSVISAIVFFLLILVPMIFAMVDVLHSKGSKNIVWIFVGIILVTGTALLIVLIQRIKEIERGEEYDARKY